VVVVVCGVGVRVRVRVGVKVRRVQVFEERLDTAGHLWWWWRGVWCVVLGL
jgi:hypothetical protein